jgi:hypothetical protein
VNFYQTHCPPCSRNDIPDKEFSGVKTEENLQTRTPNLKMKSEEKERQRRMRRNGNRRRTKERMR